MLTPFYLGTLIIFHPYLFVKVPNKIFRLFSIYLVVPI